MMLGVFLRGRGSVACRFSWAAAEKWSNLAVVVGGAPIPEAVPAKNCEKKLHGAGLRRNEWTACRASGTRTVVESGEQSVLSRCAGVWHAPARLVHSSACESTPLTIGEQNFGEVRRELPRMDLSDRVSRIVEMADAYYEKKGNVDMRMVDQFRDDVVEEVASNFKWSSLGVLVNTGSHRASHILSRFGKGPSHIATVQRLAEKAAAELNCESNKAEGVQNAFTVMSMLKYVAHPSRDMLMNVNAAESVFADAVRKVEDPRTLFDVVNLFGDPSRNKTSILCSVSILNAVYDRLTDLLPNMKIDGGERLVNGSVITSLSIRFGKVLHSRFLTAWETHILRLLHSQRLVTEKDICMVLVCFGFFNHPCSALVNTILARLEAGNSVPSNEKPEIDIFLLHDLVKLNIENNRLPQPVVDRVTARLNRQTMTQLSGTALNHLEQLVFFLPLSDGLFGDVLQFMQRVPYYNNKIGARFARQKKLDAAWRHVLLDAMCPGGRVPLICLLSCMETKTVLPWPEWLQPFALCGKDVGKLAGIPIAILVPHVLSILHEPAGTAVGSTRIQEELLAEQGYKVFSIKGERAMLLAETCCSVGELIEIAEKQ